MEKFMYPKALMTVKELQEVGYPRQILDEIAHMQRAKSPLQRSIGLGSTIQFQTNLIEEDLAEWKRINCR